VLKDVPPGATVAGVPARIVAWSSGSVPALEMGTRLRDLTERPPSPRCEVLDTMMLQKIRQQRQSNFAALTSWPPM
jgi:hypothetical protein